MTRFGLSVGAGCARGLVLERGRIAWAGSARWAENAYADLADVIGRLAAEAGRPTRAVRVVLERDVVQLRSIVPAPPLGARALRRYVTLEAPRLFRTNGGRLVVDARLVQIDARTRALLAAAASDELLRAIVAGCAEAGLVVVSLGPGAEVVPLATQVPPGTAELVFPNGGTSEVVAIGLGGAWRSRLVNGIGQPSAPWHPALEALGDEASHFAPAFGAAVGDQTIELLPEDTRAARTRSIRRRILRLGTIAACLWILAGGIYVARLSLGASQARRALSAHAATLDSALAERRELGEARLTLAEFDAFTSTRSRQLELLGGVTRAFGDSTFLIAFHVGPEKRLRAVGFSNSTARALAALKRLGIDSLALQTPVIREQDRERFAIVGRWRDQ